VQDEESMMVDLFIGLNSSIETSDDDMKRLIYQGTEQAGIDRVLDRFCTVLGLVRMMKEVEEFQDVRDEWKDNQDDRLRLNRKRQRTGTFSSQV
jgi:hypothetical protein